MKQDYSWDDQDPEQMQEWHEFQGLHSEISNTDSVAFSLFDNEQHSIRTIGSHLEPEDDGDDLKMENYLFTEIDLEVVAELSELLGPEEVELVCQFKGIGCDPRGLVSVSSSTLMTPGDLEALYKSAASKLALVAKYRHFLPALGE